MQNRYGVLIFFAIGLLGCGPSDFSSGGQTKRDAGPVSLDTAGGTVSTNPDADDLSAAELRRKPKPKLDAATASPDTARGTVEPNPDASGLSRGDVITGGDATNVEVKRTLSDAAAAADQPALPTDTSDGTSADAGDAPLPDTAQPAPDVSLPDAMQTVPDTALPDTAIPDARLPDTRSPASDATPWPHLPSSTGPGTFTISGRATSAIEVVVPANLGTSPPLVISFHGTGGDQSVGISQFQLGTKAVALGFIAVAPSAGYRSGQHPADVDHDQDQGSSSWNMWDSNPATNEDLRYVVALIEAAQQTYGVDTSRVYAMGMSNGAFFAYFVAASLPDRIAGFAENSGGWTTDQCPTRYGALAAGIAYAASAAPAGIGTGDAFPCSVLFAASGFPSSCRISATNHLRPPPFGARVPFGYLGHYSDDTTVSVQWSCILAEAMGSRAKTTIRYSDLNATGHSVMPDFVDQAWTFFAGRTNTQ